MKAFLGDCWSQSDRTLQSFYIMLWLVSIWIELRRFETLCWHLGGKTMIHVHHISISKIHSDVIMKCNVHISLCKSMSNCFNCQEHWNWKIVNLLPGASWSTAMLEASQQLCQCWPWCDVWASIKSGANISTSNQISHIPFSKSLQHTRPPSSIT